MCSKQSMKFQKSFFTLTCSVAPFALFSSVSDAAASVIAPIEFGLILNFILKLLLLVVVLDRRLFLLLFLLFLPLLFTSDWEELT